MILICQSGYINIYNIIHYIDAKKTEALKLRSNFFVFSCKATENYY